MNPLNHFEKIRQQRRQENIRTRLGKISELSIPTLERKVQALRSKLRELESQQLFAVQKDKEMLVEAERRKEQHQIRIEKIRQIDEEIALIEQDAASQKRQFSVLGMLFGEPFPKTLNEGASATVHYLKVEKARFEFQDTPDPMEKLSAGVTPEEMEGYLKFRQMDQLCSEAGRAEPGQNCNVERTASPHAASPIIPSPSLIRTEHLSGGFFQRQLREQMADIEYTIELYSNAIKAKGKRISRLEAIAAKVTGISRQLAEKLGAQIAITEVCPYCGGKNQDKPELDHIYPVSRGGLAVESNLVYICKACNQKKGDMTLATFIKAAGLDRSAVESRLNELGKEF